MITKPGILDRRLRRGAVVLIVSLAACLGSVGTSGSSPSPALQITPIPIPPLGGGVVIPPSSPLPDLVIEGLTLDRAYYFVDMDWSATVRIRNVGDIPSGSYHVIAQLCRVLEGTLTVTCSDVETVLVTGGTLDVSEVVEIGSGPMTFDSLPTDVSPSYTGEIPGVPNAGMVYIRATARLGTPGQPSPPSEGVTGNNSALATATYPSAPDDPAYDPALDADGDGWDSTVDCLDSDPAVSPWSNEFAGNSDDDDCSGGDGVPDPSCPSGVYFAQSQGGGCNPPGFWNPYVSENADIDGDGTPASGDCDDLNSALSPEAEEEDDGIDNNCNGLVDETFLTPDWAFASFELRRGWVHPGYLVGDYGGIPPFHMPALRYQFEITNLGESLGAGEDGLVDGLVLIRDLEGTIFATGNHGFVPYTAFDYGADYVPACDPVGLIAFIPGGGIYGETNVTNNAMAGNTPPQPPLPNVITEGPFDRDVRFASAPGIGVNGLSHNSEAVGSCPPLMDDVTSPDLPDAYLIGYRVFLEGELVADEIWDNGYSYGFTMDSLQGGDRICYEVRLDPQNYVFEVDEGNNTYLQVFEYHNPIIGPPRFDLIDAYSDGPGTCASGSVVVGSGVGSTGAALTPGGAAPWLGGIGGAVLLGALAAALAFYGPRWLGGSQPSLAIVGLAALAGTIVGGWGGAALTGQLARPVQPQISDSPAPDVRAGRPSCDLLLDWSSSLPPDGETHQPGDALWIEVQTQELSEVRPTHRLILDVHNPAGHELVIPMPAPDPSGGRANLDLVASVVHLAGPEFFLAGEYTWEVVLGESATGDATTPYVSTCWGSTLRHFTIGAVQDPEPSVTATISAQTTGTATATATATAPSPSPPTPTRTATPTATPLIDITGPSITKVGDSPDPIYVNSPPGCAPNTTVVSATITDPSGVASASVLFFHTTIGQVPMTRGSGDNWTATLGPFAGVGDGTADYQIHAIDEQGNPADSGFGQVTVLACIP